MKVKNSSHSCSVLGYLNHSIGTLVCCDCGLIHHLHFRIVRGKSEKEDELYITICRDDGATALYRFFKKYKPSKLRGVWDCTNRRTKKLRGFAKHNNDGEWSEKWLRRGRG